MDLEQATIKVRRSYSLCGPKGPLFKEPKSRAGRRTVEIGPTLVQALQQEQRKRRHTEHDLVCTREDGSFISPNGFGEAFTERARRLGIRTTFHGLRHTHVSMLIRAGVPINVVSARIGHSQPSVTHDVYSHLLPGMGRDAVERFEQGWAQALTSSP